MNAHDQKKPAAPPPTPGIGPKGPPPGVPTPTTAATMPANGTSIDDKANEGASEEAKATNRSKLYIVVGEVHEFSTAAKAEAFLNQPNGPKQFVVIRGHKVESKQKVTLR